MALSLISTPEKTVNGILSNVNAGRSQLPYEFFEDDLGFYTNYKVEIVLYNANASVQLIPQTFKYSPKPDGSLFVDISQIITEYQESIEGVSVEVLLYYRARFTGDNGNPDYIPTPVIQSIYAEKQLLDIGGSNMWEFLLKGGITEAGQGIKDYGGTGWTDVFNGINLDSALALGQFSPPLTNQVPISNGVGTFKINVTFVSAGIVQIFFLVDGVNQGAQPIVNGANTLTISFNSGSNYGFQIQSADATVDSFIFHEIDSEGGELGKQLTVISESKMWKGFERLSNVVIDSNYQFREDTQILFRTFQEDINKNNLIDDQFLVTSGLDPILLNHPLKLSTAPYVENAYYMRSTYFNFSSLDRVSETIWYKIQNTANCDNLIYLGWVNSKGGYEQWMFEYDHIVERSVEQGLLSESPINQDIETVSRTKRRFPNVWTQQMILTAEQLTLDQLRGLMEMKQSDYLVAYLEPDLSSQITVVVSNGYDQQWSTANELFTFSVQIEFPDNFDFLLAKKY